MRGIKEFLYLNIKIFKTVSNFDIKGLGKSDFYGI